MKTIPTTAQVSAKLETWARIIAPYVAGFIAAVLYTYQAGLTLGRWMYRTSDWLATNWPTRPTQPTTNLTESLTQIITETCTVVDTQPATDPVLALRLQGLSQRAIAAQLGLSRATIRRRLALA